MKRVLIILIAVTVGAAAWCDWTYEGQWGKFGTGKGEFDAPGLVAVAANGNVYVADQKNHRVQYFTATGLFLGAWGSYGSGKGQFNNPSGVAVTPKGTVYVTDEGGNRVQYFTLSGSFLNEWGRAGSGKGEFNAPCAVDYNAKGDVYVAEWGNHRVQYFTSTGSYLGQWGSLGKGNRQFNNPCDVNISPNGNVYVNDHRNWRVQYFTSTGSYLDQWEISGWPTGGAIAADGGTFVADFNVNCVWVFTFGGSLVSSFGKPGSGNGEFDGPLGVALSRTGARCYVTEFNNNRVQYFNRNAPAVVPTSLGRVKALFK